MCKIDVLFSKGELKALGPKQVRALKKHAVHHLRNSPEIHKIVIGDRKVASMIKSKPPKKLREKMRAHLRTTFKRLKDQSSEK